MAKVIKSVSIVFNLEGANNDLNNAIIRYIVGVEEDNEMIKRKDINMVLTGQDLANAESLMAVALSQAEDEEGI